MSKRINVSIPDADVPLLEDFDDKVDDLGLSRSEVLVDMMRRWVDSSRIGMSKAEIEAEQFGSSVIAKPETKVAQKALNEHSRAMVDEVTMIPEFLR